MDICLPESSHPPDLSPAELRRLQKLFLRSYRSPISGVTRRGNRTHFAGVNLPPRWSFERHPRPKLDVKGGGPDDAHADWTGTVPIHAGSDRPNIPAPRFELVATGVCKN